MTTVGQMPVKPEEVKPFRYPTPLVKRFTDVVIETSTGKDHVPAGGLVVIVKGSRAMCATVHCLPLDLAVMATVARDFRPQSAALVMAGFSVPEAVASDVQVRAAIASGASNPAQGKDIMGNRVVVVAARNRQGRCALRMVTPVIGPDGLIARFLHEDATPAKIKADKNPCWMLAAMFGEEGKDVHGRVP